LANYQLGLGLQTLGLRRDEDYCYALGAEQSHPQSPGPGILILGNPYMVIGSAPADDLLVCRGLPAVKLGIPFPQSWDMLNLIDGYSSSCIAVPSFQLKFSSRRNRTDLLRGGDEVVPHIFDLLNSEPTPLGYIFG
jgi:hypothetical protein